MSEDTIIALASGRGKAGIAVLRLSGPACARVLQELTLRACPEARRFSVRSLTDPQTGLLLDQAGILYMPGPHSFTGEDVAELHIHGGSAVLESVMSAAMLAGPCRLADAGEFSRRAFAHGRLDLTAAEGIADLIDAQTEGQRRAALRLYAGESARMFEHWRDRLIEAMAALEAAIDFPDEADTGSNPASIVPAILAEIRQDIDQALARAEQDRAVREGFNIAILGLPNIGKSSLFNALAGREAAIVSDIPGTTRDIIEARMNWGGFPVCLQDMAGLRETADPIERQGVARARSQAQCADLRLWVIDASHTTQPRLAPDMRPEDMVLVNKSDLVATAEEWAQAYKQQGWSCHVVSARTGHGLQGLREALIARVTETLQSEAPPLASHKRHQASLSEALSALDRGIEGLAIGSETELIAEDVRLAAYALAGLTGRIGAEDMLDQIFSRFCIGK